MGKGRKRRRVTPRQDGGAGTLTTGAVSDLRWADGAVHAALCIDHTCDNQRADVVNPPQRR
jgi:hypothetical protein